MKAIETFATFNENGEIFIDNLPKIKNQKVKLLFLFEEDNEDELYAFSAKGLSKAYSENEPEYDLSSIKQPNSFYKDGGT